MSFPQFFQFSCPTKVIFGVGISRDFSAELSSLNISKCLVVTDKTMMGLGIIHPVLGALKDSGLEVLGPFTDVPANSDIEVVKKCAGLARQYNVDGMIAIGGGSVIDTAKAANILLTHKGDLLEDYSGAQTIPGRLRPLVAIPTTAGTGSEVTQAAVILDRASGVKISFYDQYIHPDLAVLDPELTVGLPPNLTAATGFDALVHAIEAFTSAQSNPLSDGLSISAIEMINRSLVKAIKCGQDIDARSDMIVGAALAGIAFDQAMVGVVHSMAHAAGGMSHAHHGTLNFILLPYGMEYNLSVCAEKYAALANVFGVETKGGNKEKEARDVIAFIRKLQKELTKVCDIPLRLRDIGISKEQIKDLAIKAVNDGTSFYNPREVVAEELLPYLERAW